jgi:hypothetical protein
MYNPHTHSEILVNDTMVIKTHGIDKIGSFQQHQMILKKLFYGKQVSFSSNDLNFPIIQSDQGYLVHFAPSTAQLQRNMF